jgi:hypothetical protein
MSQHHGRRAVMMPTEVLQKRIEAEMQPTAPETKSMELTSDSGRKEFNHS